MIQIAIDDGACVSCSLCAEICPTDVFRFDEAKGVPEVVKPGECFGCLSCSEICPPHCITHQGVAISENYYHDPYAVRLASRLAADLGERSWASLDSAEGRVRALTDLGVRLRSVAEVFKQTVGGSLPAVGTMAGRTLARHLPRYQAPRSLGDAVDLAILQFAPAWEMDATLEDDELKISVGRCFVRELCQQQGLELGGELCVLYYNYLAGYLGKLAGVRLRLMQAERGEEHCSYEVKVYLQV